jgi:hypothetical protein
MKSEGYVLTRIENNGVVNTHQEPIEPIDCLELRTDTSPLVVAVVHARVVVVAHTRAVVVAHTQAVVAVQVAAPRELRKFLVCQQHVPHPP